MRVTLDELLNKLEVGYRLGAYETCPWSFYDGETGTTCSAEVRMGSDGAEIEAEIQLMYDTPPEGKPPIDYACHIVAAPLSDGQWDVKSLRIRGEPYGADLYNWEEKACTFFSLVVRKMKLDQLPDIDDLIDDAFHNDEHFSGGDAGGGSKAPKLKGNLLGKKGGM